MSSTVSPLPTGWLSPPKGLLKSQYPVQIAPAPLAISATLALIAGAFLVVLLMQNSIVVFLEDRIVSTHKAGDRPGVVEEPRYRSETARNSAVPRARYSTEAQGKHVARRDTFGLGWKSDDLLGVATYPPRVSISPYAWTYIEPRQRFQTPSPQLEYDSDAETLNDFEKNSAYWPLASSDASDAVHNVTRQVAQRAERSRLYDNGSMRQISYGLANKVYLGNAY
ncbi:hypothetical protein FB567DRAFT_552490 [Paraphoma chrysanthemicola]|uniref:Uncharacterized protein n=1 Tax=Paraphoma chrysanthemicola TaxID=798071 RepID=A0A8K0QZJ6_9PLEO|nr:hypothetical protein FB567DRAFT_552490 [Paraphoma chrysanthemicola]